jgi:hypothetical protein
MVVADARMALEMAPAWTGECQCAAIVAQIVVRPKLGEDTT